MNVLIQNRNLPTEAIIDSHIRERIDRLAGETRLDSVSVVLIREPEAAPPIRAEIHVAVPGPDLRAKAADATPGQAFRRAFDSILRKLKLRRENRTRQQKLGSVRGKFSQGAYAR
jgi:ribosome-associated translation inhibitor RaiA